MAVLTIEGRADVAASAAAVDGLAADVRGVGDAAATVDGQARTGAAGLDAMGEAGDNVASKASQATGAMGALAGGLDAVGHTGAATALMGVAIATDVASGAGDIMNLVASTSVGRWVAQTAATVGHTVAVGAQTVATTVMTGAQAALNAVLAANPIALLVLGLAAATAGIILLWRNSETFREIVTGAFAVATLGIRTTIGVVEDVIGWFRQLPSTAREAWNDVRDAIDDAVDRAIDKVGDLIDDVKNKPREIASDVAGHFTSMFSPILDAVGWVEDLIDKIRNIDFPDFPDINPFRLASTSTGADGSPTINLTLAASATPFDPEAWIDDLLAALREYAARRGYTLTLTEIPA